MALDIEARLPGTEGCVDHENGKTRVGYIAYNCFREDLAKAIDPELGRLYARYLWNNTEDRQLGQMLEKVSPALAKFLLMPDCDGLLTAQEARQLHVVMDGLDKTAVDAVCREPNFSDVRASLDKVLVCAVRRNSNIILY